MLVWGGAVLEAEVEVEVAEGIEQSAEMVA